MLSELHFRSNYVQAFDVFAGLFDEDTQEEEDQEMRLAIQEATNIIKH